MSSEAAGGQGVRLSRSLGVNEVPVKDAIKVSQSELECARVGHNLVTNDDFTQDEMMHNYLKKLVGRDGIEPPTPGFSVLPRHSS